MITIACFCSAAGSALHWTPKPDSGVVGGEKKVFSGVGVKKVDSAGH